MKRSRFTETQIISIFKEASAVVCAPVAVAGSVFTKNVR